MVRALRTLLCLGCAVALAACTGGSENIQTQAGALEDIRKSVAANRKGDAAAQDIVLTRELLNQITVPSLEVVAEARDRTAYLVPFSRRGDVTVWRTVDGGQVVLRNGLVTGTRGLGGDLASADFSATLAALQSGSGAFLRRLYVRNGLGQEDAISLNCQTETVGRVRLDVVGKSYETTHLRESCQTGQESIVNEFWIEPKSGVVRQSRQWVGPTIGYLRVRLLKNAGE